MIFSKDINKLFNIVEYYFLLSFIVFAAHAKNGISYDFRHTLVHIIAFLARIPNYFQK